MHHRLHNRLASWHRRAIYLLTGLLAVSGIGWLIAVYLFAPAGEPVPAPHPLAGALLATHGAAAYAALLLYALVGHAHLRTGWRAQPMHGPGLWLGGAIILLAMTGLGFYYVATEAAIPILRWTHVAAGILFPCLLALHILRGRRIAGREPGRGHHREVAKP